MEYVQLKELVQKRRSYWEFIDEPIPDETIEKIIDVVRYAPSGFNSQPWEFVVIKEPELRESIISVFAKYLPSQDVKPGMKDPMGFKTAPVFIVLYGDPGVRPFAPPPVRDNDDRWSLVLNSSLAIAYQYAHLAATSLGLATRWVSAIATPPIEREIKALLGVPDDFVTYDLMALGKSDFKPKPKKIRALSEILHYGKRAPKDFRSIEEIETHFKR